MRARVPTTFLFPLSTAYFMLNSRDSDMNLFHPHHSELTDWRSNLSRNKNRILLVHVRLAPASRSFARVIGLVARPAPASEAAQTLVQTVLQRPTLQRHAIRYSLKRWLCRLNWLHTDYILNVIVSKMCVQVHKVYIVIECCVEIVGNEWVLNYLLCRNDIDRK